VVIVVLAGKTPKKLVQRAKQQVELAGGRVLGVVLNGAQPHRSSYSYYDRYYHDESYYSS
jgi:Mrp family chromosome partitioning ATPase